MPTETAPLPPPPLRNAEAPPMPAPAIVTTAAPVVAPAGSQATDSVLSILAVLCTAMSIMLFLTWSASRKTLVDRTIPGIGTTLQFRVEDGTMMVGAFDNDEQSIPSWRRRTRARISDLSPPVSVTAYTNGWGFALPAWVPAVGFAIFPLWLVLVHRERRRFRARIESGGCLHCGYDLRASGRICPECGHVAGTLPANMLL